MGLSVDCDWLGDVVRGDDEMGVVDSGGVDVGELVDATEG